MVVEILKSIGAQPLTNLLGLAIVDLQSFVGPIDFVHTHSEFLGNLGGLQLLHVLQVHHLPLFLELLGLSLTSDLLLGDELL